MNIKMADNVNKKRSVYNLLFSAFGQIVTIAFGVILPKLFIVSFGSEVNGLLSSVTQAFVYVNLLEAGVGTATLQALYGPIARKDQHGICSPSSFFRSGIRLQSNPNWILLRSPQWYFCPVSAALSTFSFRGNTV